MFSPEAVSRDFLHSNPSHHNTTNFMHSSLHGGQFLKTGDFMASDFFTNNHHQPQQSPGLARYSSAPSSFFADLLDSTFDSNSSSSGDESDAFFSSFIQAAPRDLIPEIGDHQILTAMKREDGVEAETRPGNNGYPDGRMSGYESGRPVAGSYSVGIEHHVDVKLRDENGNRSNLLRHSSSPADFFNGFGVMGEVGNYTGHNLAEDSSSSAAAASLNLSSAPSSTSGFLPTIHETGNDDRVTGREYEADAFHHNSWNESPFNNLKRNCDGDVKMFSNFNGLEKEKGEARKKSSGLVSHYSLPKTSSEMAAVENFLLFQPETTVPCQVRAKRGFATHPRSIAERKRRTRITNNIKKLQDLFPNMDKQANTAEMLDLAVGFIKELQQEMQTLKGTKMRCVCSNKPQQTSPTT